jgi:hypothetical protein
MRNLSPSTQFLIISLLIVAFGAFLTRAILFARREYAGIRPVYPSAWSAAQCRSLEYFRLLVGLALIPLWASFLFSAPSMRTNWPSEYLGVFFLILLLLISNAWLLLLVPWNWQKFGVISRSFWITITFLVVWWGVTFAATGWMFAKASASPPLRSLSGVYAAQGLPSLARPTS